MVRPIQKNEQDENQFKFGDLGGYMGGSSNFASTDGGKFEGEGEGTGFVNASDYLTANKGKGVDLGNELTKDATTATTDFNKGVDDFNSIDTSYKSSEDLYADVINNPMVGDHTVTKMVGKTGTLNKKPGSVPQIVVEERTIPGRSAEEFAKAAEYYGQGKNAYKGPKAADIDAKYSSLEKLRLGNEGLAKTFDPNSDEGKDLRSKRLDDKAKGQGLTYGSGSRAFDAMFMEAENPDLFKSKYDALTGALKRFDGLGGVRDEKIKGAAESIAEGIKFDASRAEKAQAEGKAARDRADAVTTKAKAPGTIQTDPLMPSNEPVVTKVKSGDDSVTANSTRTTYADGSYDEDTRVGQRPIKIRFDKNGNVIEMLDENGNPTNGQGIFT